MAVTNHTSTSYGLTANAQDRTSHGKPRVWAKTIATGAALDDNSILIFDTVPVDSPITSLMFASDKLGTTGDINLGLYPDTKDIRDKIAAGTLAATDAVDEDCLATAIDVNAALVALTEMRFEVKGIETAEQKAWAIAGLSAKPAYTHFLVAGTLSEATTAAGDVSVICTYIG